MEQKILALDTSIFIYVLEHNSRYEDRCKIILQSIQKGKYHGLFSSIGLIELLAGPKKLYNMEQAYTMRDYITHFPHLTITHNNESVADFASDLRAWYGVGVPDAVHLASAVVYGADVFITNDKALKKIKEIKIELL